MSLARLFSLLVMLTASVSFAGGAAIARACLPSSPAVSKHCPCAEKLAHQAAHPGLTAPSCCSIERSVAPTVPVGTAAPQPVTSFGAALPVLALPTLARPAPRTGIALRDVPRSQGPPVFLKIRTLLI